MKNFYCIILAAGLMVSGCKKKETPLSIPQVSTTAITNITPLQATGGGSISSDGGVTITSSGICWSKTNPTPTTADSKVVGTAVSGSFVSELIGLTSNSKYYVRAYAANTVGTGYGEVVTFTTGNAAPSATAISITGDTKTGATLTANYTYSDPENDPESGTTFQWYVATDAAGGGVAAITGATAKTYIVDDAYQGKYIAVGITTKASSGTLTGTEVKSSFAGAIGEATSVTFTYNGTSVTFGIITSPTTGKKWLDRNLGAPEVPSKINDFANFGDLFQWGRLADGHQLVKRLGATNADMSGVNGATSFDPPYQLSSTDNPGTKLFIVNPNTDLDNPLDWRNPQNNNLWQGGSGVNNPCPSGWHVPSKAEWQAENFTNLADGYSKLKLTLTGVRTGQGNQFFQSATNGNYWSSNVGEDAPKQAIYMVINASGFSKVEQPRANAYAVRCIKN